MLRRFAILLTLASALCAANFRMYLKEGGFQIVREYSVEGDRVKYYSVERSDWEEIPASIVDLKRTETERAAKQEKIDRQSKELAEEDEAKKEQLQEIRKIPRDAGVYMLEDDKLRIFQLADASVHNKKGRNLLKAITPIPIVAGKATLEIGGEHSTNLVAETRPEFFIQTALDGALGIVKLAPQKDVRVVERLTIMPVVNESIEERDSVEVFTKQLTESGLYKIWPQAPLEKGDYAVVEFNEGKLDIRIWDFRIQ